MSQIERSKILINNPLDEIIIGLLLGDGHIQQRSPNNSRFMYGQSSLRLAHYNYFNHILSLFTPYLSKEYKVKEKVWMDKRTNVIYKSVNFTTLTLPCFTYYRNLFYKDKTKIVPLTIKNLLTPRGLAYWIMDDGSLQNKGLHLSVYAFTYDEVVLLQSTLEEMFLPEHRIKCSIHNHNKGYRLYIWEQSMVSIKPHIEKYMHKDMLYKITPKI